MPWDPTLYHKFQSERFAPFDDLLELVNMRGGLRVIDLGCGTGELTARLAGALPESDVVGIDNSQEMLSRAEEYSRPGIRFELCPIEGVTGEWDLIFSNAALQWVEDHVSLVPRLVEMLRPGGQLVVQVPSNFRHPTQSLVRDLAAEEPFQSALDGWSRTSPVLSIEEYAELLYSSGGRELTVYEKVYPHILEDVDALADWTSGTVLVPYFERFSAEMREVFMARYRERLRLRYPSSPIFFGFRRTLFAATRDA
ncbi:MAG TPA: methyltransferase domain-containing protein [Chloroflexia bacterium]|nr:methyltransferase domain-containing protein [Chloroflexia bacterium]